MWRRSYQAISSKSVKTKSSYKLQKLKTRPSDGKCKKDKMLEVAGNCSHSWVKLSENNMWFYNNKVWFWDIVTVCNKVSIFQVIFLMTKCHNVKQELSFYNESFWFLKEKCDILQNSQFDDNKFLIYFLSKKTPNFRLYFMILQQKAMVWQKFKFCHTIWVFIAKINY